MLYWTDERTAARFCDLTASLNASAAAKTGSFDLFFNPAGIKPTMTDLGEMTAAADELRAAFAAVPGQRGEVLRDMLRADETFLALLRGEAIPYAEAVQRILGLTLRKIPEARLARTRGTIDALLSDAGYRGGTTSEKVRRWYADNHLDSRDLVPTAERYLSLLQREARRLIDLPESEGWGRLDLTNNVVWAALSQYQGHYVTAVTMNADSVWKLPSFVDTLAHELYPGHHVWYTKREELLRAGEYPLEASLIGICMADNLLFEGAPESASHFIGMDDPAHRIEGLDPDLQHRIILARRIIDCTRILQMNGCYLHNVDGLSERETVAYMAQDGWMEPAVAERVFRYMAHPFNGLYYPAYYYGRWIVTYAYDRIPAEKRRDFLRMLYTEPHSTATFLREVERLTGAPFDPVAMAQK